MNETKKRTGITRSTIARMAGNIAGGLMIQPSYWIVGESGRRVNMDAVVNDSVTLAARICMLVTELEVDEP